ncbi:glycosyltransferase [Lichenihabitans sp. PAMC28606]|uniref:glycosyltransferase family 2 protein n=1 Tax=Lichenihabitans sp. PAMC28606 TaxID=2880932 RepID=UPI001D0A8813|nr:glycosyltransferase [Lichenihabitans sp. PAMC28606]UDL93223.1 glycosyltransferase [Lichenihabitans sp. PAMC28606]
MTLPLISVIVPAYNHSAFIERALQSVVEQSYRPIELVVIDDGSTDDTAALCQDFLSRYMPSATFLKRQNRGAAYTINQGIALSSGDYINVLNSDDIFHPNRMARCLSRIVKGKSELLFTNVGFVDEVGEVAPRDQYIDGLREAEVNVGRLPSLGFGFLRNQLAISTGNLFFSRNLYNRVGPFCNYRYVHDWDFVLRSLYYNEPSCLAEELYYYRLHGSNSFKSLADVAGYETTELMRNFLHSMVSKLPENGLAPSPHYWPGVFEHYMMLWNYQDYLPPRHRSAFVDLVRIT